VRCTQPPATSSPSILTNPSRSSPVALASSERFSVPMTLLPVRGSVYTLTLARRAYTLAPAATGTPSRVDARAFARPAGLPVRTRLGSLRILVTMQSGPGRPAGVRRNS
jgi:hypothetical protein